MYTRYLVMVVFFSLKIVAMIYLLEWRVASQFSDIIGFTLGIAGAFELSE